MKYLEEHKTFLIKHEATPRKELTKLFNKKFKAKATNSGISQMCRKLNLVCPNTGVFKKGNIPVNKGTKGLKGRNVTSFKSGHTPSNAKKAGSISIRKDKNGSLYMYMKIAEPNRWQMLHVYIWENRYGKVPKGHCVIFKDKNTLNTRLDNLMLVSRAELVRLNQKYSNIDESLKETALKIVKLANGVNKK